MLRSSLRGSKLTARRMNFAYDFNAIAVAAERLMGGVRICCGNRTDSAEHSNPAV